MDSLPTNEPINGLLNNPDAMSEHIGANIGVSSLLKGEIGDKYRPTASPFYSIGKNAMNEENPAASTLSSAIKLGASTLKNIEKGVAHLFGYGEKMPDDESFDKGFHGLYDQSNKLNVSPEVLIDHLSKQTSQLSEHEPDVAIGLSKLASNAMGIMQNLKPNLIPGAILDNEKQPSAMQIAKFNDTAKLLDNPLLIINKVANGTLTQDHIDVLQSIYPTVLDNIKQSVVKNLIQHKADESDPLNSKMRLSLSRLLGQYMDSSQSGLANNQIALSGMSGAKQQQMPAQSSKSDMKMSDQDKTKAQQSSERKPS